MDTSEDFEVFDGDGGLLEEPRTYHGDTHTLFACRRRKKLFTSAGSANPRLSSLAILLRSRKFSAMLSCSTGADLEHIAAVLADPNPSSGQLQGRRMPKRAKRRLQYPPSRANEDDESVPSGVHVSRKAARRPQSGSRLPQIPEQSPFDPKGKMKQQMPSPLASHRQDRLLANTLSINTERKAWHWAHPQRQRKHGSSEAGSTLMSPSLGQLHLDSDEEDEGPSQGRSVPSISTCAGASSSAGSSVAHGGGGSSAPRKPKARRRPYESGMHPFYDRPGEQETEYVSPASQMLLTLWASAWVPCLLLAWWLSGREACMLTPGKCLSPPACWTMKHTQYRKPFSAGAHDFKVTMSTMQMVDMVTWGVFFCMPHSCK